MSSQCLRRAAASGSLLRPASRGAYSSIAPRQTLAFAPAVRCLSSTANSRASSLLSTLPRTPQAIRPSKLSIQQTRTYAEKIVQVPQMAESITEGTLKQFSKQVGDYVEQDEEIATIETDKVSQLKCTFFGKLSLTCMQDRCRRQRTRSRHYQGVPGQGGRHCYCWSRSREA